MLEQALLFMLQHLVANLLQLLDDPLPPCLRVSNCLLPRCAALRPGQPAAQPNFSESSFLIPNLLGMQSSLPLAILARSLGSAGGRGFDDLNSKLPVAPGYGSHGAPANLPKSSLLQRPPFLAFSKNLSP